MLHSSAIDTHKYTFSDSIHKSWNRHQELHCRKSATENEWLLSNVRLEVFKTWLIKFQDLWDIITCRLANIDQRFREAYCLHCQVQAHKTLVFDCFTLNKQATIHQLTHCNITEVSNLQQFLTFRPVTSMAVKNNFTVSKCRRPVKWLAQRKRRKCKCIFSSKIRVTNC